MTYIRDEGDEEPDFVIVTLRTVAQAVLAMIAAVGAVFFVTTGSFPCFVGALLIGNAWARL